MTYAEKLKDPRWQKKRLEILQRDGFSCWWCGDKETTLHVHHTEYIGGNPWETPDIFLTTVCQDCHEIEHLNFTPLERLLIDTFRNQNMKDTERIKLMNRVVGRFKNVKNNN